MYVWYVAKLMGRLFLWWKVVVLMLSVLPGVMSHYVFWSFARFTDFFLGGGGTGFTYEEGWRFFCLFVFLLFDLYTNCTILRLSMYICQSKTKRQAWSFSWWITISQVAHLNLYVLLNKSIGKWTCPKMIHHSWYISGPAGYPFVIWSPSFFPAEPNCNR